MSARAKNRRQEDLPDNSAFWSLGKATWFNTYIPKAIVYNVIVSGSRRSKVLAQLKKMGCEKKYRKTFAGCISQLVARPCLFCDIKLRDMCSLMYHLQMSHPGCFYFHKGLHPSLLWPTIEVKPKVPDELERRLSWLQSYEADDTGTVKRRNGRSSIENGGGSVDVARDGRFLIRFTDHEDREFYRKLRKEPLAMCGVTSECLLRSPRTLKIKPPTHVDWFYEFFKRQLTGQALPTAQSPLFFYYWLQSLTYERYGPRRDYPKFPLLSSFIKKYHKELGEGQLAVDLFNVLAYFYHHRMITEDSVYTCCLLYADITADAGLLVEAPSLPAPSRKRRKRGRTSY
uniref:VEFS-Box domain-containing protein n=1 Tax=Steinernema glaseri TaxID=37863 RepID=A0A1I7YDJ3_9BILA